MGTRSILLIANFDKPGAESESTRISAELAAAGFAVQKFGFRGQPGSVPQQSFDLAISLGGDGTVLYAARSMAPLGVPILPVNLGDFGFITEVALDEVLAAVDSYFAGKLRVGERLMVSVDVSRNDSLVHRFLALNDVVISSAGISKLVRLSASLRDTPIGKYRADGVIVATPTGSTAYSAAAGGPILHPEMAAMILIPICAFSISHRPLVVPGEEIVFIDVEQQQRTDLILTLDGQTVVPLARGDRISVRSADMPARVVQSDRRTFYEVLRQKLSWSGGADD